MSRKRSLSEISDLKSPPKPKRSRPDTNSIIKNINNLAGDDELSDVIFVVGSEDNIKEIPCIRALFAGILIIHFIIQNLYNLYCNIQHKVKYFVICYMEILRNHQIIK